MKEGHAKATLSLKTTDIASFPDRHKTECYVSSCSLCDETFAVSKHFIDPKKLELTLEHKCPSCKFELDAVLTCERKHVPKELVGFVNPKALGLKDLDRHADLLSPVNFRPKRLTAERNPSVTTGIKRFDELVLLRFGQLVTLHSESKIAQSFANLLIFRAQLPPPEGGDSDIIFLDGGNVFDPYTLSQHSVDQNMSAQSTVNRIQVSRAFTCHQLTSMILSLPRTLQKHRARFALVSDITQLYCDPDVRDKLEARRLFQSCLRAMRETAERTSSLILVTNLESRNRLFERDLLENSHVSVIIDDHGAYVQLTLARHPFIGTKKASFPKASLNSETLGEYLHPITHKLPLL